MNGSKIRTLIVDDSQFVRMLLRRMLLEHPLIEVVGMATDGLDALRQIKLHRPDVVTLDIEMPRLNGIGVLERVVGKAPVSFLMISSLTQAGARITFEALDKGAFDYIAKPSSGVVAQTPEFRRRLHERVLAAAGAKGRKRRLTATSSPTAAPSLPPNQVRGWVVSIGISCGGPQTLTKMMPAFPSDFVPILITQHMPAAFTPSFAGHLDTVCSMRVKQAEHLEKIEMGTAYVAPGSHHMKLVRRGVNLCIVLDDGPKVSGHRPSADVMFESVAQACGPRSVGVVMTGMGNDGSAGLVKLHEAGGWTIAQDEETSLVFGMPKEAAKTGAVDQVVGLTGIPLSIARLMKQGERSLVEPTV